jgi:hypothetical protein
LNPKPLVKQLDWVRVTTPSNNSLPKAAAPICTSTFEMVSPGSSHAQNWMPETVALPWIVSLTVKPKLMVQASTSPLTGPLS